DVLKAIGFIPHRRVVDEFLKQYISGIQFIPVTVDVDGVQYDEYSFMNVFNTYSLLNEKASGASDFNVFRNAYNSIRKMAFCKDKLSKVTIRHDAFRVKEFPREIVITQKVKDILDANQVTGLICIPVEVK
ncbi:imm11 family protein, partial [Vibrio azureus]